MLRTAFLAAALGALLTAACGEVDVGAPADPSAEGLSAPVDPAPRAFAAVTLPARASDAVELSHPHSSVGIAFRLLGANSAPLGIVAGDGVYSRALADADVVRRALPKGVEDFVRFPSRPAKNEVSYAVELSLVAGLRLFENTLEFLDARGVPRLRVAPPFAVDAAGHEHPATLEVEGCAVSRDARPPWRAPIVSPGASSCTLVVRFGELTYPAVLDPQWTTTEEMIQGRYDFAAVLLPTPDTDPSEVLALGGIGSGGRVLDTAEIFLQGDVFDPTGAWARAPAMLAPRQSHAAVEFAGSVFVFGGDCCSEPKCACAPEKAVDLFEPIGASWTRLGELEHPHERATATPVDATRSRVLVVGGSVAAAELVSLAPFARTAALPMPYARVEHTATQVSPERVLVCGGRDAKSHFLVPTCELYDQGAFASKAIPMTGGRAGHAAAAFFKREGVLLAGGDEDGATSEICDPIAKQCLATEEFMRVRRAYGTATIRSSGNVIVAGGLTGAAGVATSASETFTPGPQTWGIREFMAEPRARHQAVRLTDESVLVLGGLSSGPVRSCESFEPARNGTSCDHDEECASAHCVDRVCCDHRADECTGCRACSAMAKNGGEDGVCEAIRNPPPACSDGRVCTTNADCASDQVCSTSRTCASPLPYRAADVSCRAASHEGSSAWALGFFAAGCIAFAVRARRSRCSVETRRR